MATNGERASKRDHVIAVTAIIISGLVTAAGVFVTWQSSKDAQETTRESLDEQRRQADLAELRSVIDRAAADLQRDSDASTRLLFRSQPAPPV